MLQALHHFFMQEMTGAEWRAIRALFGTLYLAWAGVWGVVAWHYFRASYTSWISQGGTWKLSFRDFFAPATFSYKRAFRGFLNKFYRLAGNAALAQDDVLPDKYTIGHYLRFSIFVGALSPAAIGFLLFDFDRSHMIGYIAVATLFFVMVSLAGAAGHLFVVFNKNLNAWSWFVILLSLWVVLSPIVFYLIHWP